MPTDRTLITLADLVRRAQAIIDPNGADPAVTELVERFDDDDEPVRGILDSLEERLAWGVDVRRLNRRKDRLSSLPHTDPPFA